MKLRHLKFLMDVLNFSPKKAVRFTLPPAGVTTHFPTRLPTIYEKSFPSLLTNILVFEKCVQIDLVINSIQPTSTSLFSPGTELKFIGLGGAILSSLEAGIGFCLISQASLLLHLLPIITLTYSFRIPGCKSSVPEAFKVLSK